jgi:acylpyruvate hydrolase
MKLSRERLIKDGLLVPVEEAELLAPVLNPGKVVCLGLNYRAHAAEGHWDPPEHPILFHKTAGALIGRDQAIRIPHVTNQVDYEGELAVIIGKRGKYINESSALDYVAGYSNANDVSARDLQFRTRQWTTGKMLDTFCPLGPALVTRDEVPSPNNLEIKTTLNDMVVQHANTSEMIFNVPFIISYVSSLATLDPGDVILTGTPEGIGNAREPKLFMKPGDVVNVEIEGLGVLSNRVEKE